MGILLFALLLGLAWGCLCSAGSRLIWGKSPKNMFSTLPLKFYVWMKAIIFIEKKSFKFLGTSGEGILFRQEFMILWE
jgi:hypothetical protein